MYDGDDVTPDPDLVEALREAVSRLPCQFVYTRACKGGRVGTRCNRPESEHCGETYVHHYDAMGCKGKVHHPFHRTSKTRAFREATHA